MFIYYTSVFVYNLFTENYIKVDNNIEFYWGLTNNVIDAPLMILFLTYFSTSKAFSRNMKFIIASLILFEAVVIAILGFSVQAITIIMGPALLIVIGLCLYFFIRNTKLAIEKKKATGKAVIISSLLFLYGCYTIIYLMYYVFKAHIGTDGKVNQEYMSDTFLIYFISVTLSSVVISIGLIIERKRIQKLKELKVTRKELSALYTETKRAVPFRRTAMLDFDREQWN